MLETICKHCQKSFFRRQSELNKSKNHFCSKSCAASHNNKQYPKRIKKKCYCKKCGVEIPYRHTVCKTCSPNIVDWSLRTLGETKNVRKYQVYSRIRELARRLFFKANSISVCQNCGYDKHVEICHLKPISSFSGSTPISIINDLSNLIALCPNCHWELDHSN